MPIPPSIKQLAPSLIIDGDLAPSTEVVCTLADFQAILNVVLADVEVDEEWYLQQYPDVEEGVARGASASAREHYRNCGYLEARLPSEPVVDEEWYKAAYGDVATGIRQGKFPDAKSHYIQNGYREGRLAQPSGRSFPPRLVTSGGAGRRR